jgi:hypothetical protein
MIEVTGEDEDFAKVGWRTEGCLYSQVSKYKTKLEKFN